MEGLNTVDLFKNKTECCGCGLCKTICKQNAIKMEKNDEGFLFPVIDASLCIDCGACRSMCAFQNDKEKYLPSKAYAAIAKEKKNLEKAASGGVFATIANKFIDEGGWVCGSILEIKNNSVEVYHTVSNDKDDVVKMQGSKYAQSNIEDAIPTIIELLRNNNRVMFCGTPCQVDAVKKIAQNDKNLFLTDLICHGVPSNDMLNSYLDYSNNKKTSIKRFEFRDNNRRKTYTAKQIIEKKGKTITKYKPAHLMSYYQLFLKGVILRDNCYQCPYTEQKRCGDITIGDYWGLKRVHAQEYKEGKIDDRNWSCLLVNTDKGNKLIRKYKDEFEMLESELEKVSLENEQLKKPVSRPIEREKVMNMYVNKGYKPIEKWYRKQIGIKYYLLLIRYHLLKR